MCRRADAVTISRPSSDHFGDVGGDFIQLLTGERHVFFFLEQLDLHVHEGELLGHVIGRAELAATPATGPEG